MRPGVLATGLALALIVTLQGIAPLFAQGQRCGSLADVLADLRAGYHETLVWQGSLANGAQILITAAPDGGTWTALAVEGTVACLVSAGTGWKGTATPNGKDI